MSNDVPADLLEAACDARRQAYARYSNHKVGAAVRALDGRIFAGCNVENASYPLCVCAERNALAGAVVAGVKRVQEVLIVAGGTRPSAPCGACRQVIAEFAEGACRIWSVTLDDETRTWSKTLDELLPDRFGPEDLP